MTEKLPAIEIETKPKPSHAVIWLHGLGADGNDFVPVVKQMKLPRLGIRFVFPHAPMRPVTINGGFVMRAWYDIAYHELAFKEDERGLRDSQKLIEDLIARENARGIPSSRIVLAGFSQGGVMTLQVGLRQPKRLAGLMALSAYLPMSPMIEIERNVASASVPIFMGHGIADNIVPLALGAMSRDTLSKLGYELEWHQYPMPHSVCAEELADISAWLKRVLL
jgi:phospholipase/carboxylesterase